jgi:hypothetical protein
MEMPARRRLAVTAAVAVVSLLALVALASRSGVGSGRGSGAGPEPSEDAVDYLYTFGLALLVVLAAATLWTMRPSARFARRRGDSRPLWPGLLAAAIVVGAVLLLATQVDLDSRGREGPAPAPAAGPPHVEAAPARPPAEPAPQASVRWTALLAAAGVVAAAAAVLAVARARRRRAAAPATSEADLLAELAATVDDAYIELEAEPDPRRAVIAAYARMERALAAHGLGRRAFEAPLEYLARIAPALGTARRLVFELTHLYERARFSAHAIDREMKADAIATLAALRDELREAA